MKYIATIKESDSIFCETIFKIFFHLIDWFEIKNTYNTDFE